MKRLKETLSRPTYRKSVTVLFFACVIICGAGSVILSFDYLAVYDTANNFSAGVSNVLKATVDSETRIITVILRIYNNGSRPIRIFGYSVIVELNDGFVAQRDIFDDDVYLNPGTFDTIIFDLIVTGLYAQRIIDAEQTGEWNWLIRYPMRVYVAWLYVAFSYLGEVWHGVVEV